MILLSAFALRNSPRSSYPDSCTPFPIRANLRNELSQYCLPPPSNRQGGGRSQLARIRAGVGHKMWSGSDLKRRPFAKEGRQLSTSSLLGVISELRVAWGDPFASANQTYTTDRPMPLK